ncbi:KH domain-containing protein [Ditylenchus destructor]|nr:KH domain-containing protein [Ditylenchus destructor]
MTTPNTTTTPTSNISTTNSQQFPANITQSSGFDGFRPEWQTHQPPVFQNNNVGEQKMQEKMSIDHLLQLMSQVSASIKAGDFSTHLADNIFVLCQQLKVYGQHLEQSYKNDLNKIFVSLRQACCRDNGQLGTPCRLKMMEIVELRAMGWRPNYSHTQYYLNRPEQPSTVTANSNAKITQTVNDQSPSTVQQFGSNISYKHATSQPPISMTTSTPSLPFNYCVPPPQAQMQSPSNSQYVFVSADNSPNPAPTAIPTGPGYILIPATGGWSNPMVSVATPFMPQSPVLPHMGNLTRAPPLMSPDVDWQHRQMIGYLQSNSANASPIMSHKQFPGLGNNQRPNLVRMDSSKSSKSQQFREEMTIRNCDSGKIMGVKGRRVALVEELSKTVISFQKVEPKSKDRVLTITGPTEEAIQQAKKLIEETIHKNVSPTREGTESANAETEDEEDDPGISIETSTDGTLKLCCADPDVLQAAQVALSDYLNRAHRSSRMSAGERELRKERRKSMPLQTASDKDKQGEEPNQQKSEPLNETNNQEVRRKLTGSTPNLANENPFAIPKESVESKSHGNEPNKKSVEDKTIRYDRAVLLTIAEGSSTDEKSQNAADEIKGAAPEILRKHE